MEPRTPPPIDSRDDGTSDTLDPNLLLLEPGVVAPIPLVANPRQRIAEAYRRRFHDAASPKDVIEPAAIAGASLLHASQELILGCHELVGAPVMPGFDRATPRTGGPLELRATRCILWSIREFLGAAPAAYGLEQAAAGAVGDAPQGPFERVKDFEGLFDRALRRRTQPIRMETERMARLGVLLDGAYDLVSLNLQGFYAALQDRDPNAFLHASRRLSRSVTRTLIPAMLADAGVERENAPEKPGLFALVPELEAEFL